MDGHEITWNEDKHLDTKLEIPHLEKEGQKSCNTIWRRGLIVHTCTYSYAWGTTYYVILSVQQVKDGARVHKRLLQYFPN